MTGLCVVKPLGTFITFRTSLDFWSGLQWYTQLQQAAFSRGCQLCCFRAWNISPALLQASPPLPVLRVLDLPARAAGSNGPLLVRGEGTVYSRDQKGTQWGTTVPAGGSHPWSLFSPTPGRSLNQEAWPDSQGFVCHTTAGVPE